MYYLFIYYFFEKSLFVLIEPCVFKNECTRINKKIWIQTVQFGIMVIFWNSNISINLFWAAKPGEKPPIVSFVFVLLWFTQMTYCGSNWVCAPVDFCIGLIFGSRRLWLGFSRFKLTDIFYTAGKLIILGEQHRVRDVFSFLDRKSYIMNENILIFIQICMISKLLRT